MPVLKIYFSRFERMTGLSKEKILDRLPYLGLDIEGTDKDSVRIEYNPNRPDFSTDYGIARAMRGLVGKETGVKQYRAARGKAQVFADKSLAKVRPFIACAVARKLKLDDETIRQLISMQEDLHNGLGRKRRKVAIGLHDLVAITFPVYYSAKDAQLRVHPAGLGGADDRRGDTPADRDRAGLRAHTRRAPRRTPCSSTRRGSSSRSRPSSTA